MAFALALISLGLWPGLAWAYVGPGTGLSAVGAFLALVAGLILAIFGFIWYPLKRLLKKRTPKVQKPGPGE